MGRRKKEYEIFDLKNQIVTFKLDKFTLHLLDQISQLSGRTRSDLIRAAIKSAYFNPHFLNSINLMNPVPDPRRRRILIIKDQQNGDGGELSEHE